MKARIVAKRLSWIGVQGRGEDVPIARPTEDGRKSFGAFARSFERRPGERRPQQADRRPQASQGDAHLVHAFKRA